MPNFRIKSLFLGGSTHMTVLNLTWGLLLLAKLKSLMTNQWFLENNRKATCKKKKIWKTPNLKTSKSCQENPDSYSEWTLEWWASILQATLSCRELANFGLGMKGWETRQRSMHWKLRRHKNLRQSCKTGETDSELWGCLSSQDLRGQDLRRQVLDVSLNLSSFTPWGIFPNSYTLRPGS